MLYTHKKLSLAHKIVARRKFKLHVVSACMYIVEFFLVPDILLIRGMVDEETTSSLTSQSEMSSETPVRVSSSKKGCSYFSTVNCLSFFCTSNVYSSAIMDMHAGATSPRQGFSKFRAFKNKFESITYIHFHFNFPTQLNLNGVFRNHACMIKQCMPILKYLYSNKNEFRIIN